MSTMFGEHLERAERERGHTALDSLTSNSTAERGHRSHELACAVLLASAFPYSRWQRRLLPLFGFDTAQFRRRCLMGRPQWRW